MNPWCPDAGTSEETRFGEGSSECVHEGQRVSCLVPTSGRSGRGVNFGDFELISVWAETAHFQLPTPGG